MCPVGPSINYPFITPVGCREKTTAVVTISNVSHPYVLFVSPESGANVWANASNRRFNDRAFIPLASANIAPQYLPWAPQGHPNKRIEAGNMHEVLRLGILTSTLELHLIRFKSKQFMLKIYSSNYPNILISNK